MGRKKVVFSDEERARRKQIYNQTYASSKKGQEVIKENKRRYYRRHKNDETNQILCKMCGTIIQTDEDPNHGEYYCGICYVHSNE